MIKNSRILILASRLKDLILKNCARVIWYENDHIKNDGTAKEITQAYFS
jgi:ABC-type polysaccharide/polyol phosphate transport system ATPase subunit